MCSWSGSGTVAGGLEPSVCVSCIMGNESDIDKDSSDHIKKEDKDSVLTWLSSKKYTNTLYLLGKRLGHNMK